MPPPVEPPNELLLAGRAGAAGRLALEALERGALLERLAPLLALLRDLVRLLPAFRLLALRLLAFRLLAFRLLAFFLVEDARDERALELRRELAVFFFELDDLRAGDLRPRDEDALDLPPFFRVAISTPFCDSSARVDANYARTIAGDIGTAMIRPLF